MKQEWIEWFAYKARRWLDRIDRAHAPKAMGWWWTFEKGGIQFNEEGRGSRVWYLDDDEYQKAWDESKTNPYNPFLPVEYSQEEEQDIIRRMTDPRNRDVVVPAQFVENETWNDIESPHHHLTDEELKEVARSQARRAHMESTGHDIANMIDDFAGDGGLGMFQQIDATFGGIAEGTADARTDHQIDKAVGDIQSHAHRVILSRDDDGNPKLDS